MDHKAFKEAFEDIESQLALKYDLLPKGKYYHISRVPAVIAITTLTAFAATLFGTSYYAARKVIDSKAAQASLASIQAKEIEAQGAVDRLNAADSRLVPKQACSLTRTRGADRGYGDAEPPPVPPWAALASRSGFLRSSAASDSSLPETTRIGASIPRRRFRQAQ